VLAIVFYLAGYLLMTYLAFLVLLVVERAVGGDDLSHFNGLAKRSPGLALAMLLAMVSLAGLPFTVGFFGKFFIFETAMQSGQVVLVTVGVAAVVSGFYYYLKVVRAMYWQPALDEKGDFSISNLSKLALAVLSGLIIVLGFYPQPVFWLMSDNTVQANSNFHASSR
jgi:NADH-quinone oxidoreductase subunit N